MCYFASDERLTLFNFRDLVTGDERVVINMLVIIMKSISIVEKKGKT